MLGNANMIRDMVSKSFSNGFFCVWITPYLQACLHFRPCFMGIEVYSCGVSSFSSHFLNVMICL